MLKLHRLNPVRSSIRAGIRSIRGLGQEWIRTTEGVKPANLQSAPFGRFGTYPDFPLRPALSSFLRSKSKTRDFPAMGASYIEPWQRLCKRILQLKLRIFPRKTRMPIFSELCPAALRSESLKTACREGQLFSLCTAILKACPTGSP